MTQDIKRAVVLVPGFDRRERLDARDRLVRSIEHYTDGFTKRTSDGVDADASIRRRSKPHLGKTAVRANYTFTRRIAVT